MTPGEIKTLRDHFFEVRTRQGPIVESDLTLFTLLVKKFHPARANEAGRLFARILQSDMFTQEA